MTVPGSWRGSPTGDPGAFSFFFYCDDLSTTWREINVRDASLLAGADVAQQLAAAGVTADEAEAAAVIRTVSVQNLDNADGVEYSRWAAVGTTDPPTPPSAKAVALPNGAVIFDAPATRMSATRFQIRTATGTGTANVVVTFDVPRVLP
jgi:hypothetical protein